MSALIPRAPGPPAEHEVARALPDLLLGLVERRYLDDFEASRWVVDPWPGDAGRPVLSEIVSIGRASDTEGAAAMPRVLTSCHARGHAVVVAVHGTGDRHRLLVGGRRVPGAAEGSTQDYLEGQASALRGHVPGLRLSPAARLDAEVHADVARQIREAPALAVITGVPSPRTDLPGGAAFQGIEQLAAATGTHRYTLLVVAEPLPPAVLDRAVDDCRLLRSEIRALIRRTVGRTSAQSSTESTTESTTVAAPPDLGSLGPLLSFGAVTGLLNVAPLMLALQVREERSSSSTSTTSGRTESLSESLSTEVYDAVADACDEYLQQQLARLQRARSRGWWRTAVYVAAESDAALTAVTSAVRSIASGDSTAMDPVRVVRPPLGYIRTAMLRGQILRLLPQDGTATHPLGQAYEALATCLDSDELAVLVNLPRRNVPGLDIREIGEFSVATPKAAASGVLLGRALDGQQRTLAPVTLTADALNRHMFIGGMTGYGKTTTAMNLLVQARSELGVPFLVIEPVKAEYRSLQRVRGLPGYVTVYTIGEPPERERRAGGAATLPLRLNPFEPVGRVPLTRHIDLLKAVFNASFPMVGPLSYILEEAILRVYEEYGWSLDTSGNDLLGPYPRWEDRTALVPTIQDVSHMTDVVLAERRYGGDVHQNIGAALRSRLRSLTMGAKGMTLDTRRSVPLADLFDRPVVIELQNLGDDDEKAFVIALLLCRLYEYAEARHHERPKKGLRHLTLIEEAHRLLRTARAGSSTEIGDPQAKAVTMFTDMLAEMRAYGEGFMVADQVPTKLTPDVLKNSNIKILHRLVAPDDRAAAGGTINLTEAQSRHLATLPRGIAIVHDDGMGSPTLVDMQPPTFLTADAAAVPARPQDRGYLLRNSACRHCPAPCDLLSPTRRHPDAAFLDDEIGGVLDAVHANRLKAGWTLWQAWRTQWLVLAADTATAAKTDDSWAHDAVYCAASQAGYAWLERWAQRRAEAVGLTTPAARDRLAVHHAGRAVAEFVKTWCGSTELDPAATAAAAELGRRVRADIAARPPVEMLGCRGCTARCRALDQTATTPPTALSMIASQATGDVPLETRRNLVRRAAGDLLRGAENDPQRVAELVYCMTTLAGHRARTDVRAVLDGLRGDGAG